MCKAMSYLLFVVPKRSQSRVSGHRVEWAFWILGVSGKLENFELESLGRMPHTEEPRPANAPIMSFCLKPWNLPYRPYSFWHMRERTNRIERRLSRAYVREPFKTCLRQRNAKQVYDFNVVVFFQSAKAILKKSTCDTNVASDMRLKGFCNIYNIHNIFGCH